ncbi:MAG TPA: alpha/beta fold hydrolase [Dehalococcoidia bacterium]|nr:alpha/beta fold hydrolase [Dehalococcoidia bacterium]
MPVVRVNGVDLYYEERGTGDPLLLIQGFGGNVVAWGPLIPAMAEHFRVIAFDNRDAGRSSQASAPYTIADMAGDAAGLLETLGISSAHVLGASMGGMIAQEFALRYPSKLRALVLMCTTCGGPNSAGWDELCRRLDLVRDLREAPAPDSELVQEQLSWMFTPEFLANPTPAFQEFIVSLLQYPAPLDGMKRQAEAIRAHDTYDRLPQIAAPTLVIAGEGDPLIPAENSRILAQRIPGAQLILYPRVRHGFNLEIPDRVHADILSFLQRARTLATT